MRATVSVSLTSARKRCRHNFEELVAGRMPESVVDRLEVVEVEQVHGHHIAAPHAGECVLEPLVEQHTVGQIGQRIVQRHVHDLGLGAALVGDVLVRDDACAVRCASVGDIDDAPIGQFLHLRRDLAELADEMLDELLRLRGDIAAVGQPMLQDFAHVHPRPHLLRAQTVHVAIVLVANDEPLLGVVHGKALGHIVHGGIELFVLLLEVRFQLLALGNVLVRRHPTAPAHRLARDRDGPTVAQPVHRHRGFVETGQPLLDVFLRVGARV